MPEDEMKSVLEIDPDVALEACLDAQAESAFQAGRVVSHDHVSARLEKLANGEKVPPPRA